MGAEYVIKIRGASSFKMNTTPLVVIDGIEAGSDPIAELDAIDPGNIDKIVVFAGARATKYKGISTLINATKILVHEKRLDNFIIHYAGDGPDMDSFRNTVKSNQLEKYFIFLGQLKDTHKYLCNAHIVVVPSAWGDAFPSAVSEALAAGNH